MANKADKKTQYAPNVPIWLKEVVRGIGQHINLTMGDAAGRIVMESSRNSVIITKLAPYFWRTLERGDLVWPGRNEPEDISAIIDYPYDRCERLKFRLSQDERREIDDILFALAVPDAHAVGALLILGVHDRRVINAVAPRFAPSSRYTIERRSSKWGYSIR